MPPATRFLQSSSGAQQTPDPIAFDSDVVVILAALLCALICVVGLALVARCAWLRRTPGAAGAGRGAGASPAPPASKGLKKKALMALPKTSYTAEDAGGKLSAECAICLAEFEEGDEVRVLPQCGHGFHVGCVDTWLGSHASCPSCRRVLVAVPVPAPAASLPPPSRCHRCGARSCQADEVVEVVGDADRFLP